MIWVVGPALFCPFLNASELILFNKPPLHCSQCFKLLSLLFEAKLCVL